MAPLKKVKIATKSFYIVEHDLKTGKNIPLNIYVDASGMFYTTLPNKVIPIIQGYEEDTKAHDGELTASTREKLEHLVDHALTVYRDLLMKQHKRKVVRINFAANRDISFCDNPVLHITSEVGYLVNDRFYREGRDTEMKYGSKENHNNHEPIHLDWTPEREKFFADAEQGLYEMIEKIQVFLTTIKKDPTLLDTQIHKKKLLGW